MPQQQLTADQLIFDDSPVELPTGLVFIPKETNRTHLQAALQAAGLSPAKVFPTSTRGAFALISTIGYRVDRSALDYCLARGYIQPPPKADNVFSWREKDVIAFADALESLRRWLPLHPSHVHKMTAEERAKHTAEANKRKAAMEMFVETPINELLNLLAGCDDRETREMMVAAIKIQTGLIHIRGNEQVQEQRAERN